MLRREKLFEKWTQRKEKLFAAYLRIEGAWVREEVLRREFGVKAADAELFDEWFRQALSCGVSREQQIRETAYHEAGHAVIAELLLPGTVVRAVLFWGTGRRDETGGTEHDAEKLNRFGYGEQDLPLSLSIRYMARFLAGGFFQLRLGGSSPVRAHNEARGDQQNILSLLDDHRLNFPDHRRCRKSANDMLSRLGSHDRVCRAVEVVAQVLIRDRQISGERTREIIAIEIGSIETLLSSLGIPFWGDPAQVGNGDLTLGPGLGSTAKAA